MTARSPLVLIGGIPAELPDGDGISVNGTVEISDYIRVSTTAATPVDGSGMEFFYAASQGFIQAMTRAAGVLTMRNINIRAAAVTISLGALGSSLATVFTLSTTAINMGSGIVLQANGTQVVGTRKTGWTAATGTPTRTTFATSTVTLPQLAERVKALIDDLISHGLIGT